MSGVGKDAALIMALTEYAGVTVTEVARRAKIDPETLRKPTKGITDYRLSQRTIEKLQEAYPKFPGWTRAGAAALASFEEPVPEMVSIAAIDLNFGLGAAFMDSEIVEHEASTMLFPRDWLRSITRSPPERLYWAKGLGNSMEPTIGDGDVILIDRSAAGSTFGDLYWAIAYGQTGMIKRLRPMPDGSVKILSDNPNVPPELAHDGELHVFGRVIAVVRRI
jgi:SOS-response transcriptional repressor LexA